MEIDNEDSQRIYEELQQKNFFSPEIAKDVPENYPSVHQVSGFNAQPVKNETHLGLFYKIKQKTADEDFGSAGS
jgi:hypothetical protein